MGSTSFGSGFGFALSVACTWHLASTQRNRSARSYCGVTNCCTADSTSSIPRDGEIPNLHVAQIGRSFLLIIGNMCQLTSSSTINGILVAISRVATNERIIVISSRSIWYRVIFHVLVRNSDLKGPLIYRENNEQGPSGSQASFTMNSGNDRR